MLQTNKIWTQWQCKSNISNKIGSCVACGNKCSLSCGLSCDGGIKLIFIGKFTSVEGMQFFDTGHKFIAQTVTMPIVIIQIHIDYRSLLSIDQALVDADLSHLSNANQKYLFSIFTFESLFEDKSSSIKFELNSASFESS
ncbi:hypothetical protein BpHYR1_045756 [Brachionus plicatilis]|uniref:Uncharacterized protein n=1 Tax=Brachionus plicatilis TaxID=10195 RepID=A0A3M7RDQ9_BRAPC|nr:hypothetical protein BpHYR1_045756 [Brachionus plicatilis]